MRKLIAICGATFLFWFCLGFDFDSKIEKIYYYYCADGFSVGYQCPSDIRLYSIRWRVNPESGTVVYQKEGMQPSLVTNCAVMNNDNWLCNEEPLYYCFNGLCNFGIDTSSVVKKAKEVPGYRYRFLEMQYFFGV